LLSAQFRRYSCAVPLISGRGSTRGSPP
jgi:hypothetical protein